MYKTLQTVHIIAVCVFVGSIPSHIILGAVADPSQGLEIFALHMQIKHILTAGLTGAGLAASLISGVILGLFNKRIFKSRWLQAKLFFIALIIVNGAVMLTPLAAEMKNLANAAVSSGTLAPEFFILKSQESIAGAINLALIIGVISLATFKPLLRRHRKELANG